MNRKDFFKKTCFAGACLCGFSTVSVLANNDNSNEQVKKSTLSQDWLANLLSNLNHDLEEDVLRKIIKKSAIIHYDDLKMDNLLAEYVGNIDKFNKFVESNWGWKVDYNKVTKVIVADENKANCVCPILEFRKGEESSAICYCSEGFAEKMFSKVAGMPVKASVISSVRRGDSTCKYRIEIS